MPYAEDPFLVSDEIDTGGVAEKYIQAYWGVDFKLPPVQHKKGFLVQEVSVWHGNYHEKAFRYYEAWHVSENHKRPNRAVERKWAKKLGGISSQNQFPEWDDAFGSELKWNSHGEMHWEGILMFFELEHLPGFRRDHPAVKGAAGHLLCTTDTPGFWIGDAAQPFWTGGGVQREFHLYWRYAGNKDTWHVDLEAMIIAPDREPVTAKKHKDWK